MVQWRDKDRGDTLIALTVESALRANAAVPQAHSDPKAPVDKPAYPAESAVIAHSPLAIEEVVASPAGDKIAFETGPVAHRLENPADTELFVVPATGGQPIQVTHNQGSEGRLAWDPAGKHIYVLVRAAGGSIEGPYQDVQGRIYSIDLATGIPMRMGATFDGSWEDLTVAHDGTVFAVGLKGINQSVFRLVGERAEAIAGKPGAYGRLSVADQGGAMLFTHSEIGVPPQVFIAKAVGNFQRCGSDYSTESRLCRAHKVGVATVRVEGH